MNRHRPTAAALSRALSRAFSASASAAEPSSASASSFPQKLVTRSNFEAALAELRRHVRAADFVAVDLEMSGVTSAPWRESLGFDRSDVLYLKVKHSAEKFAVIQFGVCPFRWDSSKQTFVAYPHNFYIFPRQELPTIDRSSYEFIWQTGSIDFLARYQFDFNACIREGISYLSRRQEDEALRRLNSGDEDESSATCYNSKDAGDIPLVAMADILFSERMKNRLSEWHDWLLQPRNREFQFQGSSNDSKQKFQTLFFMMWPAVNLIGFTSHQLRLIQLVVRKNFKDLTYVHVKGDNVFSQHLVVYTDSKDDRDLLIKEVNNEHRKRAEKKIQAAVGFRHVVDLLSSERKLIVGHNCFLDIAHVYNKFIGPLPSTAEEFVSSVSKYFPHIIDTKILLNTHQVLRQRMKKSKTSLSSAFTLLCPHISLSFAALESYVKVEVEVDDLRSSSWNSGAKHDAGYDAFMTGCIFAQACGYIGIDFKLHSPSESLAENEKLQKHINLLYLSWTNADIIDLTNGNKVTASVEYSQKKRYSNVVFENVVLIWGFPSELKARHIRECFSKTFGVTSVTFVYQMDPTAVFVQFSKTKLVSDFLSLMETLEKNNDPISVLHPLSELLKGGNTRAATYETYKQICGTPISKVLFADQAEAFGAKRKTDFVESSKTAMDTQEDKNPVSENSVFVDLLSAPWGEKAAQAASNYAGKTKPGMIDNLENDSFHGCLSGDEILNSVYAAEETQLVRTS
ncbi:poly(A)-specific ribonuclease PARN [Morus notabilis]|uniref:poly(A)-specific ribonuclease PARN n=1 Tax=Morus notabilis TaxID=981085 RepID=UPI000CED253F|nr:poly(A)-specific ribonuclease PARN [Morus notabilis]